MRATISDIFSFENTGHGQDFTQMPYGQCPLGMACPIYLGFQQAWTNRHLPRARHQHFIFSRRQAKAGKGMPIAHHQPLQLISLPLHLSSTFENSSFHVWLTSTLQFNTTNGNDKHYVLQSRWWLNQSFQCLQSTNRYPIFSICKNLFCKIIFLLTYN